MSAALTLEIYCDRDLKQNAVRYEAANSTPGVIYTRYDDFGSILVRELAPNAVRTPLFSARFDCIDVGRSLAAAEFSGKFCVLAVKLPNRQMVERELQRQFPKLDLCVINHDQLPGEPIAGLGRARS